MKHVYVFCSVVIFLVTTFAYANPSMIKGFPIKIGNTVEEVQKALDTKLKPEKIENNMPPMNTKQSVLYLKTKGIRVFFEKGRVFAIEIAKPFSGSIGGVKIGDSASKIEKNFGTTTEHEHDELASHAPLRGCALSASNLSFSS